MGVDVATKTTTATKATAMPPAARIVRSLNHAVSAPVTQRAVKAINAGMLKAGRRPAVARRRAAA